MSDRCRRKKVIDKILIDPQNRQCTKYTGNFIWTENRNEQQKKSTAVGYEREAGDRKGEEYLRWFVGRHIMC